jgi:hypothetical protein
VTNDLLPCDDPSILQRGAQLSQSFASAWQVELVGQHDLGLGSYLGRVSVVSRWPPIIVRTRDRSP